MPTEKRKLVTVITEASLERELAQELERLGAHGYTVADVRGKGGHGERNAGWDLALVGDAADGYPGLPGFGAKSTAAVLRRFGHIEAIPADGAEWRVNVVNAGRLAHVLREQRDLALLFKTLATLRTDASLFESVDELRWRGPTAAFAKFAEAIESPDLAARAERVMTLVASRVDSPAG